MDTKEAEGGGKLTRERIEIFLIDARFLNADGEQVRSLDQEIVKYLIGMNGGPQYLDLSDRNLARLDFPDAYLSGADLSGADLRNVNLRRADLRGADLRNANLGADLRNANLISTDLGEANLRDAKLAGADIR
jgi:uncharacterized protein YjbI with pentapeptide repeats